jgi:hypothetical protein
MALFLRTKRNSNLEDRRLELLEDLSMSTESDVRIGKFDILATYSYARALLESAPTDEAKVRGIVAAIMGAKAKLGHPGSSQNDHQTDKTAAEEKKKTTITAESFDHQVADTDHKASFQP